MLSFVNTPVPSNTFLLVKEDGHCIVIDPGTKEQADVRDYIQKYGLRLDYIILTHDHFDHCWGVTYLLEYYPAKVVATKITAEWIAIPKNNFNQLYYNSDEMFSINKVDLLAEEIGWMLEWQNIEILMIDAKGHTKGSMCVKVGNALFTGDTMIFKTKPFLKKKYGGSYEDLKLTIFKLFDTYPNNTIVYPGHGESFLLGDMKSYYLDYFKIVE